MVMTTPAAAPCPASGHMEWAVPGYVSPQTVGNDIAAAMRQANACWGTPGTPLPSGHAITSQITGLVAQASARCPGCRYVAYTYPAHQFSLIRTLILAAVVLVAIVAVSAVVRRVVRGRAA